MSTWRRIVPDRGKKQYEDCNVGLGLDVQQTARSQG